MSIHVNNLHTTTKDPTAQSDLPYIGRRSLRSWDPPLHKEVPPLYQGIQVSSPLLYKQQTLTVLRYVNSPYLLHFWVLGDSSITDLTFGGSLADTPPVLSAWFFSFVLQVHPLACVWMINSLTIFVHHQCQCISWSHFPLRCKENYMRCVGGGSQNKGDHWA